MYLNSSAKHLNSLLRYFQGGPSEAVKLAGFCPHRNHGQYWELSRQINGSHDSCYKETLKQSGVGFSIPKNGTNILLGRVQGPENRQNSE